MSPKGTHTETFSNAKKVFLDVVTKKIFLATRISSLGTRIFFLQEDKISYCKKKILREEKYCFVTSRKKFLASEVISVGVMSSSSRAKRRW